MELCNPVTDITLYPRPEHIAEEKYRVFNLQGATEVKYYVNGMIHGFRTKDRIITGTRYTGLHRAFNINGVDKYAVGYIFDREYQPNKLELVNLQTGKVVLETFGAYKAGQCYLAFRVNDKHGDRNKHRWGLYNMVEDRLFAKPVITTNCIDDIFKGCEAVYQQRLTEGKHH